MTRRYLLDTNILSHAIRDPQGATAKKLQVAAIGDEESLCTSVIVECELVFGARRVESRTLLERIAKLLDIVSVEAFSRDAVASYAELRTQLQSMGTPIGPNDMLIAAHALALDCILVTDNEKEFARVPGLIVENWLR